LKLKTTLSKPTWVGWWYWLGA